MSRLSAFALKMGTTTGTTITKIPIRTVVTIMRRNNDTITIRVDRVTTMNIATTIGRSAPMAEGIASIIVIRERLDSNSTGSVHDL